MTSTSWPMYFSQEMVKSLWGLCDVQQWSRDDDGELVGERASNPILDIKQYEVKFPDRSVETYSTNLTAENLFSQINDEGCQFQLGPSEQWLRDLH
jgi:hypothetical protein